jgi:outer membrane protein TolC
MHCYAQNRQTPGGSVQDRLPGLTMVVLALAVVASFAPAARAQLSLTTAVDLALRSNPRVQGAQADVARAQSVLAEAHDAYIPTLTVGAGIGQAYGYLPNPPTLFTVNSGSMVYNASQSFYVRSARAGLKAAQLSLKDVREAVAQDTALALLALAHDQQRERAIHQQAGFAETLVNIVQERVDAGEDSKIDLTQAKLTAAQLRLTALRAGDDTDSDRKHLALLTGLPAASLSADDTFPANPLPAEATGAASAGGYATAAVASLFASAEAKQQQAKGDEKFRFWPELNSVIQYNRYATFTNSFKTIEAFNNSATGAHIGADEAAFGAQILLPFFDKARSDRARQASAEAAKAQHDAQNAELDAEDGQNRARHAIAELQAQAEVAGYAQQLSQQQLDVLQVQLQNGTGNPNSPPMTPKDEQKARIDERDKYLGVVDAGFQLRQAEIQLLRQTGQLEEWLKTAVAGPPATLAPKR